VSAAFLSVEESFAHSAEAAYFKLGRFLLKNVVLVPRDVLLPEDDVHGRVDADAGALAEATEDFVGLCAAVKRAKAEKALLLAKAKNLRLVLERQELLLARARELKGHVEVAEEVERAAVAMEEGLRVLLPELDVREEELNDLSLEEKLKH
jgi:hypothetical protein